tara:strand:- start:44 stop:268 length:225 start_codon:yes stop_codon:yes gene_type:complete
MIKKEWNPLPSEKAPQLDEVITAIFGIDRKKSVKDCTCAMCGDSVELDSFKDEISLKEFHISAMCQPCQDKVFG